MPTGKVSDQTKILQKRFDNTGRALFNAIVKDVADKLRETGLVITVVGAGKSATLIGIKNVVDENEYKETSDKVRHTIEDLKNSDLLRNG